MPDNQPEEKISLWNRVIKIFTPIGGFVGAIMLVYNFYQLLLGDQTTVTYFFLGGGLIVFIATMLWMGFGTITVLNPVQWPPKTFFPEKRNAYSNTQRFFARIALGFAIAGVVIFGLIAGIQVYKQDQIARANFVILVADFTGPDPENYQVTDELIQQLRTSLSPFKDTVVVALGKEIKEADGSVYARSAGAKIQADVVLWGRYSVSGNDVILNIHVENLTVSTELPATASYESIKVNGVKQFEFRERFSHEMSAFTLFMAGLSRYEAEDYASAFPYFDASLEQNAWPDEFGNGVAIYYFRGMTEYFLSISGKDAGVINKYLDKAEADFSEMIRLLPENPDGYFYRSQVYKTMAIYISDGNKSPVQKSDDYYQRSIADISRTIELDPKFSGAYLVRATIYLLMGEPDLALADYQAMPQDAYALYWQGIIHDMKGQNQLAVDDLTKAVELDPSWKLYYDPHSKRGQIYTELKKYNEAMQDFETSHKLGEPDYLYYQNYGRLYQAQGIYDKALQYYTYTIQEDPKQPSTTLSDRGRVYYELKQYKNAIQDLTTYIENHSLPGDYYPYYYRGLSYQFIGDTTHAQADFSKAVPGMLIQGARNLHFEQYEDAFQVFDKILLFDKNNLDAFIGRARALTGLKKYIEALPDINRAIELDSKNSEAYGVRSVIYLNLSNMEGAISDWKKIMLYSNSQKEIDWANKALKDAGVTP